MAKAEPKHMISFNSHSIFKQWALLLLLLELSENFREMAGIGKVDGWGGVMSFACVRSHARKWRMLQEGAFVSEEDMILYIREMQKAQRQ
jgi:hypothetical protein